MGHIWSNCPLLNPAGKIHAPTLGTLRITNGQQGKVNSPRAKGPSFQLKVEEAGEAPEFEVGCSSGKAPT